MNPHQLKARPFVRFLLRALLIATSLGTVKCGKDPVSATEAVAEGFSVDDFVQLFSDASSKLTAAQVKELDASKLSDDLTETTNSLSTKSVRIAGVVIPNPKAIVSANASDLVGHMKRYPTIGALKASVSNYGSKPNPAKLAKAVSGAMKLLALQGAGKGGLNLTDSSELALAAKSSARATGSKNASKKASAKSKSVAKQCSVDATEVMNAGLEAQRKCKRNPFRFFVFDWSCERAKSKAEISAFRYLATHCPVEDEDFGSEVDAEKDSEKSSGKQSEAESESGSESDQSDSEADTDMKKAETDLCKKFPNSKTCK